MISIELIGVSKGFRGTSVLKDVSVRWEGGHIYGLVGRNGSGKTVLMKMICGFMPADSGIIKINEKQISNSTAIPEGVSAIIEAPGFLPNYSGYRNLQFLADIQHKLRKDEIFCAMERVGLDPKLKKRVGAYSLGMRQRLGLAQALMEDTQIMLLDEPMNGLDDDGIKTVRDILVSERERGKLIVMASHMKDDLVFLCDEIFRVHAGNCIRQS